MYVDTALLVIDACTLLRELKSLLLFYTIQNGKY